MQSNRKSWINGIIYIFGVTSCPLSPSVWFMITRRAWMNVSLGLIQTPHLSPNTHGAWVESARLCLCVSVISRWNSKLDEWIRWFHISLFYLELSQWPCCFCEWSETMNYFTLQSEAGKAWLSGWQPNARLPWGSGIKGDEVGRREKEESRE